MSLSLSQLLKAGVPPPKVVLLPDRLFFVRTVPIAPAATAAAAAEQAQLALEGLSPFPLPQLYHGTFWVPGAERALVFAAYRRRFTTDQTADWPDAELVLPQFAALIGRDMEPATTLLAPSADGLTAIHWDGGLGPSGVWFRPVAPEATDVERAALRAELLREAGETLHVIELTAPPTVEISPFDHEFVFSADEHRSRLDSAQAALADVRDKDELAALRSARARSVLLWRTFLTAAAALALLLVGEIALIGGGFWQKARLAQVVAQRPVVEKIETAQNLATRINELSTKRLLPFEMLAAVTATKPEDVTFLRATTDGLYTLTIDAQSLAPAAVSAYQTALGKLPALEQVEIRNQQTRENVMAFTLAVTFRPGALKPAAAATP